MNILILNWRDIKNPKGGGAEVLTHEMAKRWVKKGNNVTQFSERFIKSKKEEIIDGVRIMRSGSADIRSLAIPVHVAAFFWYQKQKRGMFDAVIDEIHGIPFFTPWYVREKKVAFICEVADRIWDVAFPFPINTIGSMIERSYFQFYRDIPFLTISPSTKKELLLMGVYESSITILPMGLSIPKKVINYPKEKYPTLLFVARLTRAKGTDDAITIVDRIKKDVPNVRLWIVGQGEERYTQYLRQRVDALGLRSNVQFFGFVNQDKKFELMSKAQMLIVPSFKEGWGLTVPEAGYMGTPAVAYDVEGLRDTVKHQGSGILTDPAPENMSREVLRLMKNSKLYKKLQNGAQKLSQTYSWDLTAKIALSAIESSSV